MSNFEKKLTTFLLPIFRSKDDIFLLYGAIYSGENAKIVSNDYMRQHKHAIGRKFNDIFKKWQQEHWYGFIIGENNKPIELVKPMQYKMFPHKTEQFWHLPFKSYEEANSKSKFNQYALPKNWACIQIKKK